MDAVDLLIRIAGFAWAGTAICITLVSLISDEPVRCGFDVIKGAGK